MSPALPIMPFISCVWVHLLYTFVFCFCFFNYVQLDINNVKVMYNYRYELLFYPRYHLDQSSLLCRKPLLAKPMVMDVYQEYMLVTYRPFDVHIFHVKLFGELTPFSTPDLQVKECFLAVFFFGFHWIRYYLEMVGHT